MFIYLIIYEIKFRGHILNLDNVNEEEVEKIDFGKLISDFYEDNLDCLSVKVLEIM